MFYMPARETDPRKLKIQLNVPIRFEYMEHLDRISHDTHISRASLVRAALEATFPMRGEKPAAEALIESARNQSPAAL